MTDRDDVNTAVDEEDEDEVIVAPDATPEIVPTEPAVASADVDSDDEPDPEIDERPGESDPDETGALDDLAVDDADAPEAVESGPEPETEQPAQTDGTWSKSTGALLLGALDPADAAAAGLALVNDVAARSEIVSLLPVADILTSLYQTQNAPVPAQDASAQGAITTRGAALPKAERPRSQPVAIPKGRSITPSTILAIVFGILAALGILWALAQRDQTATREQEIDALRTRVADLELGGNASVFVLNPVSDEAAGAKATVFYSPGDGTVLLSASGLPELDDDQVYQVWYQANGEETWQPGPTFRVNDSGEIVRRLGSETPGFSNMAITIESAPGSTEPTGDPLLQGELVRAPDQ